MEIKKVRKSDLKELISKALKLWFKIQDSDYEIDINTIYAVIKIKGTVITRERTFEESYKEKEFASYIKLVTFSNVTVAQVFISIDSEANSHIRSIELAINYEIIDE